MPLPQRNHSPRFIGFCLDTMERMFLVCSRELQLHSESTVIFHRLLAQGDASWMQSISETGPKRACGWQRNSRGIIRSAFISWTKRKISRGGPLTSKRKSSARLRKPLSLLTGRNNGNSPRPDEPEKNE
jgi:hypothetical protein